MSIVSSKDLNMFQYFGKCLIHYFDFKGRARRKEFWSWVLVDFIYTLFLLFALERFVVILDSCKVPVNNITVMFACALKIPLVIPCLAVIVRRLHDLGKSGWFAILLCLCVVSELFMILPTGFFLDFYWIIASFNAIVYLCYIVFFFLKKGNTGTNKYGEDPLAEL